MALEIERKFLVDTRAWEEVPKPDPVWIVQGYLQNTPEQSIRIRIAHQRAFLTVKSGLNECARMEFEYEIPLDDAQQMLTHLVDKKIEKWRYTLPCANHTWEVDVFEGANKGLVIAEIELENEHQEFDVPEWISTEVTVNANYLNASLVVNPFTTW